ncbi:MAG: farnesyl-diphosphate synthase [Gemmataceae bacterium]|nr:farnesyl-diphosphate synthase [Gemmataceae bacterium]
MSGDVWDEMRGRQERVEAALRDLLASATTDTPPALAGAMGYSLFAPGKRLRPLLAILACEAAGGTAQRAMPAACAVEMVHTYSLIHDDLPAMDDDDLRRGQPTCHKKFGEALAILAGDALLTLAFEIIGRSYGPRTAAVSCVELATGAGAAGMVGGQVLDLEAEGRIGPNPFPEKGGEEDIPPPSFIGKGVVGLGSLETIHRRKTGALIRSALRLGVYAAQGERDDGVSPDALSHADAYAAAFGLAFQVTDDLLDVEGTADKTGKRVGKDAARGKLTYPGLLGIEESRRRAAALGREAVAAAGRLGSDQLARLAEYLVSRER